MKFSKACALGTLEDGSRYVAAHTLSEIPEGSVEASGQLQSFSIDSKPF